MNKQEMGMVERNKNDNMQKKLLFVSFVFVILLILPVFGQGRGYYKGDANLDGKVNVLDVVKTVRVALGYEKPKEGTDLDLNGDGKVNVIDVVRIVRISLGYEEKEIYTIDMCSDGTPYGECSKTKPKFCQDGTLIDNCQVCGCPVSQKCQTDGNCREINVTLPQRLERGEPEFVEGEILVKFKPDVEIRKTNALRRIFLQSPLISTNKASINTLNKKFGVRDFEKVFRAERGEMARVYKLKISREKDVLSAVKEYKKNPNIEYAEPNYIFHTSETIPNEYPNRIALVEDQWGLDKIQAPEAWDIERGKDIVIAIVDTGVDYNHEDLTDNIWINEDEIPDNGKDDDGNGFVDDFRGYDFVDLSEDNLPYCDPNEDCEERDNDPMDLYGHGTHCSGIAAAVTNNSKGVAGVCWNCKILAVRSGWKTNYGRGRLEEDDSAAAIEYATNNKADIISMSWGGFGVPETLRIALEYASNEGVILVAAAGNWYTDVKYYPAAFDQVIGVSATDQNDAKAYFSNYGEWVDLAAPGVDIKSTTPNNSYDSWRGTSMACPHVSGLAGLILSKDPISAGSVREILQESTDSVRSVGKDIGAGRINALKAMLYDLIRVKITSPSGNNFTFIGDLIPIRGTAWASDFKGYTLEYGMSENPAHWELIAESNTSVINDVLGVWNTSFMDKGEYTIRLIARDRVGRVIEDRVTLLMITRDSYCSSCIECNYKLQTPNAYITLIDDIEYNLTGEHCLLIGTDNVTFDCDEHSIKNLEDPRMYPTMFISSDNVTVKNCEIKTGTPSIGSYYPPEILIKGSGTTLLNNVITGGRGTGNGVFIGDLYPYIHHISDNVLINNTISSTWMEGIQMYASDRSAIINNTIFSINSDGIEVHSSSYCTFSNNKILSNAADGFRIFNGHDNVLSNNLIRDNYENGLTLGTSGVSVFHNSIYNNNKQGDSYEVYSKTPIELSYKGRGNFWGHAEQPYFVPGVDSNREDVKDSCPYNQSYLPGEWPASPVCPPECGNNIQEVGEECDGFDDEACPELCQSDCTCKRAGGCPDYNGDHKVDVADLTYFLDRFNTTPEDPNWNRYCDFNDDGKVDESDLNCFTRFYGEAGINCPEDARFCEEYSGGCADYNRDEIVDNSDLEYFINHLGTSPHDPNWDPYCDFNGDQVVNKVDRKCFDIFFGKSMKCPEDAKICSSWPGGCGDYNSDHIVDSEDLDYFMRICMNTTYNEDPKRFDFWCAYADFNDDWIVNETDLGCFNSFLGQAMVCPRDSVICP
jgi:parallel beta-helix repeat protein